jgi:signal transduction histidine kinase
MKDNEPFHRRSTTPVEDNHMHKFWRQWALSLLGSIGLVFLTLVYHQIHSNLAIAGFSFVIITSLISLAGNFVSSITVSFIAALCLAYLAPPDYSLRVDNPLDVVAIAAFLTTSEITAFLVFKLRNMANAALSSVTYNVVEAEERERKRLSMDLHEDIGQRLSLLAIEIDSLKKDLPDQAVEVRSRMDAVRKKSLGILTDVKELAHELYSPRFEYLGLAAIMRSFCSAFGQRRGLEINFESHGLPNLVPPDISLCLFRVLQEALQNALKHSGVRQFDVQLRGTSGEIQLEVREIGAGFHVELAKTGLGLDLNHMQARLKLVNGTLFIESQPEQGTTIFARVPFTARRHPTRVAA